MASKQTDGIGTKALIITERAMNPSIYMPPILSTGIMFLSNSTNRQALEPSSKKYLGAMKQQASLKEKHLMIRSSEFLHSASIDDKPMRWRFKASIWRDSFNGSQDSNGVRFGF